MENGFKRIFLIGYMGAGKTTLGKQLAKALSLSFIDLDSYIEQRYHKSVGVLFAERGEAAFREIERMLLAETSEFENTVISTGGGAPCFFDNIDYMNQRGLTVYLKTPAEILAQRLEKAQHTRPLLRDKTPGELLAFIQNGLQVREPFYSQARLIVDTTDLCTPDAIIRTGEYLIEEVKAHLDRAMTD